MVNTFDVALKSEGNGLETPCLLLDFDRLRANASLVRTTFTPLHPSIFYSVKANSHPSVLRVLSEEGLGFDVASIGEIMALVELGVPADRMIFSSTVKVPSHIAQAYALGIDRYSCDSPAEIAKLAQHAPGSRVLVRVQVPHSGSRWPLAAKFGVPPSEALKLLGMARAAGLQPYGLTFHVGSQCLRPETWLEAIDICAQIWERAHSRGITLRMLNMGGGFPAYYDEDVPSVPEIGNEIVLRLMQKLGGTDIEYALEPGRSMVANTGALLTTVIGKARRNRTTWLFVDLSVYAGLLEVTGGWTYTMTTTKDHLPRRPVVLAGPSCDSTDILARHAQLPDLEVGDRIMLHAAGAYTIAYEHYNGFRFPEVVALEGARESNLAMGPAILAG